jgi:hypothetical protein
LSITLVAGLLIAYILLQITTNNGSSENRGLIAALKSFLKLSNYFDLGSLSVKFPPKPYNDFGDAHLDGCDIKKDWLKNQ